jgi:hypothetical protein
VLEYVNSRVTLLTLSILSIASFLLSILMLANTNTGIRQVIAILMLFATIATIGVVQKKKILFEKAFNSWSLKAWLGFSSIVTILFIVSNNDVIIFLLPGQIHSLYLFTICFNSLQFIFILGAIFEVRIKRHAILNTQRRYEQTDESESSQIEDENQIELADKWQKATKLTFESITKKYVSPSAPIVLCPHCSFLIDFNQRVEWLGPSALKCGSCKKAVEIADLIPDN